MSSPAIVTGWGRTQPVATTLVETGTDAARALWADPPERGIIARGLGRSYGDAAQTAGGATFHSASTADETTSIVIRNGVVTVPAAMSLDALMSWGVPRGWFVPVTPGTRRVTVGGAIAADVHGKNHHRDGTIGAHTTRLWIETPGEGLVEAGPGDDLFNATVGGMGLTGVVTAASIRMMPIETSSMMVTTQRCPDLDRVLETLNALDSERRYTVAWMDLLARGASMGRGVIMSGEHADLDDLSAKQRNDPLDYGASSRLDVPDVVPGGLLNAASIGAFNIAWYLKSPRHKTGLQTIPQFFHPLDGVGSWNRLYGPRGFLQYQFVLPDREEQTLRRIIDRLSADRVPSFLTVLKRFGPQGSGLLSFPTAGWTLTLDIPALERFAALLDRFDEEVAAAGGRIYLAKDARMHRRWIAEMYPRLERWREIRHKYDPDGVMISDLDRRLDLSGRWS